MKDALLDNMKGNTLAWRKQGTITKAEGPTDPARARRLGYRAKQGFSIVRVRVPRGGRKRPKPAGGRVPKKAGRFFTLNKSKRSVAEEKAERRYSNLRVLNSYEVGEDGTHKWFECILVDPSHPAVKSDRRLGWIAGHKGRAARGLTSAGKKGRGLRRKGMGAEKVR